MFTLSSLPWKFSNFQGLQNPFVSKIVKKYIKLCQPAKVTILTDSKEDKEYIRRLALKNKEEKELALSGHTIHFDGFYDQARDKQNTKILIKQDQRMGKHINVEEREEGLAEIFSLLKGIMTGKEMLVSFYCLGPVDSRFSIPALQITDSAYVCHSENILYRSGFEQFKKLKGSDNFFHFVHSAGELENGVSKNVEKKRIYIDLEKNRVFSVNTQYAGNTVGLKKLALRLAINKANKEGWLTEHMLLMEVKGGGYFTGAFPSACGKTSTAMVPEQSILGDDITYLRTSKDGRAYGVNVEKGIFGIIADVNPEDDPIIYKTLTTKRETIFSNVLIKDKKPYWLGMGKDLPKEGVNYYGKWKEGLTDKEGNEILPAHKNARYTVRIKELENADPNLHNPEGVPISGIIYGGRDSDTFPPVAESFSWEHGVFMGASLESETTTATLGKTGVRKHDPMANLDFLVIPLGTYINNHLKFGKKLINPPKIFITNYFLMENGQYLNRKTDKKIWLYWMASRISSPSSPSSPPSSALTTPIGFIPTYQDLKSLFYKVSQRKYSKTNYVKQFSIRITHLLEKLNRIEAIYSDEQYVPRQLFTQIKNQRSRLQKALKKHKKEVISPFAFA